jgi:hypothetical protein
MASTSRSSPMLNNDARRRSHSFFLQQSMVVAFDRLGRTRSRCPTIAVLDNDRGAGIIAGMTDVWSHAHFGGVGLKVVEASGAVALGRDHAGTERVARDIGIAETRGIGQPAKPAGTEPWAGEPRHRGDAQVGERQARVLLRRAGGETANAGTPGRATEGVRTLPGWQQAVMRGALHGLATQLQRRPRDAEAWLRLIRSRLCLGEGQAAREALARALATFSDDASVRARIATDARLLGITRD